MVLRGTEERFVTFVTNFLSLLSVIYGSIRHCTALYELPQSLLSVAYYGRKFSDELRVTVTVRVMVRVRVSVGATGRVMVRVR